MAARGGTRVLEVGGMIHCKDHLPPHFLRRTQVTEFPFMLVQGAVDVWSNRSLQLPYGGSGGPPPRAEQAQARDR